MRCAVPSQEGASTPSFPYIQSAPTTWSTASTPITVVTTTFISMTVSKPRVVVPSSDGSCTRPKTPTRSATTAPTAKAASGTAMPFGAVESAMGSGCSRRRSLGMPRRDPGRPSEPGGTITPVSTSEALSSSQLVEMSTELPDVVLKDSVNWTNITFKGKGFAWVNHTENHAMIKAHHDERDALLATSPEVYEAGWATNSTAWVRVRLELADADEVLELLEEAWRMTATKRAIRALDETRGR